MSPSATTTVVDRGAMSRPKVGQDGFVLGAGGGNGGSGRANGRPMMHIDDIKSATVGIDRHEPVHRILAKGEECFMQSATLLDFGRPDMALREYLKACEVAIEIIPQNKKQMVNEKGEDLNARYNKLFTGIRDKHGLFERIKEEIKQDNQRTGVQSSHALAAHGHKSSQNGIASPAVQRVNGHSRVGSAASVSSTASTDSALAKWPKHPDQPPPPVPKAKPAVHPKPQSLAGNAIRKSVNGDVVPSSRSADLAARFANLRSAPSSPSQDPRIKTQPIVTPRPLGPREMPPPQRPTIQPVDSVPSLPKLPDAIYSPARGTVSSEAADLPSSTPHGIFSRTNSTTSFSNAGNPAKTQAPDGHFSPAQTASSSFSPLPRPAPKSVKIPEGDTISVGDLLGLMRAGVGDFTILLIDARHRGDFEDGHIMSQATICIEPEILARANISAEQIAESLVLAPTEHQNLFEARDAFDLVVVYDQESSEIPPKRTNSQPDPPIRSLINALHLYSYPKELINTPKLLAGGIDAWVEMLGSQSLQQSSSKNASLTRSRAGRAGAGGGSAARRMSKYISKPIQDPNEARKWEEILQRPDPDTISPLVRTPEDFLRRFPPVSPIQESMSSPIRATPPSYPYGTSHQRDLYSSLPSPPARPPPALPRQSYTGLRESEDGSAATVQIKTSQTKSVEKRRCGLNNPGNWCYANSLMQALLACPGFSAELSGGSWQTDYHAPRKPEEKIEPPQLMTKAISIMFHWMRNASFGPMHLDSLMNYCRTVDARKSTRREREAFGGPMQHDASEFRDFVLDLVHDETNILRNVPTKVCQPDENKPMMQGAMEFWNSLVTGNHSLVFKYFSFETTRMVRCDACNRSKHQFEEHNSLILPASSERRRAHTTLRQCMDEYTWDHVDLLEGYVCDHCKRKSTSHSRMRLVRVPEILCVVFSRFDAGGTTKNNAVIEFPLDNLMLDEYFGDPTTAEWAGPGADPAIRAPFVYDACSVVMHSGSLAGGHYWAFVRDDTSSAEWTKCNDSVLSTVRPDKRRGDREMMYQDGQATAYMVFYKRRH